VRLVTFIFLCLLSGGLVIEGVRKYILKIKDPTIEDIWLELDEAIWFKELMNNEEIKHYLILSKENGLLKDPHYVRNILDKEGHREGFINYITKMAN
jgi:hypothetical protein